jgi:hypothetical protein
MIAHAWQILVLVLVGWLNQQAEVLSLWNG